MTQIIVDNLNITDVTQKELNSKHIRIFFKIDGNTYCLDALKFINGKFYPSSVFHQKEKCPFCEGSSNAMCADLCLVSSELFRLLITFNSIRLYWVFN